jgi:hypothetical protein
MRCELRRRNVKRFQEPVQHLAQLAVNVDPEVDLFGGDGIVRLARQQGHSSLRQVFAL